jgi:hypoxanthine phosphoribosyltransferase
MRRYRLVDVETSRFVPVPNIVNGAEPRFAHPSEQEFARILDFYGLRWDYEPLSFPLQWDGDRAVEMLTPDFYLPDLDLYLELTTMKQSLVTQKNRKIRRLRHLYPEVNIKLLYRRDFHRLLAKFGFGPLVETDLPGISRVLYTERQIQQKVHELGRLISRDYVDRRPILIGVQRGMVCFMADVMRHISLPARMDFMSISHYSGEHGPDIRITKELDLDIDGSDVILIEDIVDTGMTLNWLIAQLRSRRPTSVEVCALLDKRARRIADVDIKYVGFEAPDEFLVGYGLDYMESYRNLPFIGVLRPVGT